MVRTSFILARQKKINIPWKNSKVHNYHLLKTETTNLNLIRIRKSDFIHVLNSKALITNGNHSQTRTQEQLENLQTI